MVKVKIIFIVVLISVAFTLSSCEWSDEVHYSKALLYEKSKDCKSAIKELNSAIEKNPNFARAYLERGKIRFSLDYKASMENLSNLNDAYELSINDFTKALALDSEIGKDALIPRGLASVCIKNYKTALDDFEEIFKRDSSNKQAISNITMCKVQLGDIDGAKAFLDRIIAKNPEDAENYYGRAVYKLTWFKDTLGVCEDLLKAKEINEKGKSTLHMSIMEDIKKLININCNKKKLNNPHLCLRQTNSMRSN